MNACLKCRGTVYIQQGDIACTVYCIVYNHIPTRTYMSITIFHQTPSMPERTAERIDLPYYCSILFYQKSQGILRVGFCRNNKRGRAHTNCTYITLRPVPCLTAPDERAPPGRSLPRPAKGLRRSIHFRFSAASVQLRCLSARSAHACEHPGFGHRGVPSRCAVHNSDATIKQTNKQTREGHNRHNRFFYFFFSKNQSPHGRINYHIISYSAVAVVIIICCHCVHVHTPHRLFFFLFHLTYQTPGFPAVQCRTDGCSTIDKLRSCRFYSNGARFLRGLRITYADSRCLQT